jgi:hypothetical protein
MAGRLHGNVVGILMERHRDLLALPLGLRYAFQNSLAEFLGMLPKSMLGIIVKYDYRQMTHVHSPSCS